MRTIPTARGAPCEAKLTKAKQDLGAMRLLLLATTAVVPIAILAPAAQAQTAAPSFDIPPVPCPPPLPISRNRPMSNWSMTLP